MEKFAIEIESAIGWVNYHFIMRPGQERATQILQEVREQFPKANFRIVKWTGEVLGD